MNFTIKLTRNFEKEAKPLLKKYPSLKKDITKFIDDLKSNPGQGTSLGHGLFKVRIAISSKNQGKSGGARIITYAVYRDEIVYLISIYDKAAYDTADVNVLIDILKQEGL